MKLTEKQINALHEIGRGAQFSAVHPTTRRSLFRLGLVKKDWNHRHANAGAGIEYLQLTDDGLEAIGANVY